MDASRMITAKDVAELCADPSWAGRFPPLTSVDQVAELLQIPKSTVYGWSSHGTLDGCEIKVRKYARFMCDRLLKQILNDG